MKKLTIFLFIAALLVNTVSAQDGTKRERPSSQTIEGTLKLEKGIVAVQSGDNVYLAPTLTRYIGFISGLQEGAAVSVEGFIVRNTIQPSKLTINSNSYDLIAAGPRFGNNNPPGQRRGNLHPPAPSPRNQPVPPGPGPGPGPRPGRNLGNDRGNIPGCDCIS